jgi:hypothetical protein
VAQQEAPKRFLDILTRCGAERGRFQRAAGGKAAQEGGGRGDDQSGAFGRPAEPDQRIDASGRYRGGRRPAIVRQGIPGRQRQHVQIRCEEGQRPAQPREATRILGNVNQPGRPRGLRQIGQHPRIPAFRRPGDDRPPRPLRIEPDDLGPVRSG